MRKSFSPAKICNCCSNKKPSLVVDDISSVLSQQLPQSEAETTQDYPISNICLPSLEEIVKCKCPTLRHVPKKIRSLWSKAFTETLQDCVFLNDTASFMYLFMLSKVCLRVPPSNLRSCKQKDQFTSNLLNKWRCSADESVSQKRSKKN